MVHQVSCFLGSVWHVHLTLEIVCHSKGLTVPRLMFGAGRAEFCGSCCLLTLSVHAQRMTTAYYKAVMLTTVNMTGAAGGGARSSHSGPHSSDGPLQVHATRSGPKRQRMTSCAAEEEGKQCSSWTFLCSYILSLSTSSSMMQLTCRDCQHRLSVFAMVYIVAMHTVFVPYSNPGPNPSSRAISCVSCLDVCGH